MRSSAFWVALAFILGCCAEVVRVKYGWRGGMLFLVVLCAVLVVMWRSIK